MREGDLDQGEEAKSGVQRPEEPEIVARRRSGAEEARAAARRPRG
jgi:hypothetical protein